MLLAFKNQWSAQIKKPFEFLTGLFALILNNSFYLYGIYLLAILSVDDNPIAAKEYLASTGVVLISWGLLNVFGGGLLELGCFIETGGLENYLAKPQSPLLLVAISKSNLMSIGEVFQGMMTMLICYSLYGPFFGMRMLIGSGILIFAFAGILIFVGSLSFFSTRGSQVSYVILQVLMSLSLFPVGRALKGKEKWILYTTPLFLTATLSRLMVMEGELSISLAFFGTTVLFVFAGTCFFNFGLKRYQSKNYIFINE